MTFDLQGHRGARALRPENTLPSFEIALDLGVTSLETDLHLTRDGVPVLIHEPYLSDALCSPVGPDAPDLTRRPFIRDLTLAELRRVRADRNPRPADFPRQRAEVTPRASSFAAARGIDPFAIPTLAEFIDFVAGAARLDLEFKHYPFHEAKLGIPPGVLERATIDVLRRAGIAGQVTVRSFDHRAVALAKQLAPELTAAVLIDGTTPAAPAELARAVGAVWYCPRYTDLDCEQVAQLHAAGVKVLPWTVNDPADFALLQSWGVDGITTDDPGIYASSRSAVTSQARA